MHRASFTPAVFVFAALFALSTAMSPMPVEVIFGGSREFLSVSTTSRMLYHARPLRPRPANDPRGPRVIPKDTNKSIPKSLQFKKVKTRRFRKIVTKANLAHLLEMQKQFQMQLKKRAEKLKLKKAKKRALGQKHYVITTVFPTACRCTQSKGLHEGTCYTFTNRDYGYCRSRVCNREYVCVTEGPADLTCMRRKVTKRIVPNKDGKTCTVKPASGYRYVPYA